MENATTDPREALRTLIDPRSAKANLLGQNPVTEALRTLREATPCPCGQPSVCIAINRRAGTVRGFCQSHALRGGKSSIADRRRALDAHEVGMRAARRSEPATSLALRRRQLDLAEAS